MKMIPRSEFARNVVTVMSGTALAQAIPVLISPLLTRLFLPAELGGMATFISLIAVGAVLATGRYELAVHIPRSKQAAFNLSLIGIVLALVVCGMGLVGISLFAILQWNANGGSHGLSEWAIVLPIGILLMGVNLCLSNLCVRNKRFAELSFSKVGQSGVMGVMQLSAGLAGIGVIGLICGYLLGLAVAVALLVRTTAADSVGMLRRTSIARLRAVLRRHANFPRFMIPGQLANVASSHMPVLLLGVFYGPAVAGFYSLAERVLILPSAIIGTSIGDVYRQRAAEEYQATGQCRQLFIRTAGRLSFLAAIPLITFAAIAPWAFGYLFGTSWQQSGFIASLLSVMVYFQMISSPLSQTVLLAGMHRLDMLWQFSRLVLSAGSIILGEVVWADYRVSVGLYALSFALLYALHSLMQYRAACGNPNNKPSTLVIKGGAT
jgi:O-antigen/teichoic acid export membrane protein